MCTKRQFCTEKELKRDPPGPEKSHGHARYIKCQQHGGMDRLPSHECSAIGHGDPVVCSDFSSVVDPSPIARSTFSATCGTALREGGVLVEPNLSLSVRCRPIVRWGHHRYDGCKQRQNSSGGLICTGAHTHMLFRWNFLTTQFVHSRKQRAIHWRANWVGTAGTFPVNSICKTDAAAKTCTGCKRTINTAYDGKTTVARECSTRHTTRLGYENVSHLGFPSSVM